MKYYFILNPNSGRKTQNEEFLSNIRKCAQSHTHDVDVYFTKHPGDGRRHVTELCQNAKARNEHIRIYGRGGDGTLHELINGAMGFDNVEIGIIPRGTGNDYVRNYGSPDDFQNIENQLMGESHMNDLIRYEGEYRGEVTIGYCANMFNIGFDSDVVDMADKVKIVPFLHGSMAYLSSIFLVLAKMKKIDLRIEFKDEAQGKDTLANEHPSMGHIIDDKVLMTTIAKGRFCGGGILSSPRSCLDDGFMDVMIIDKNVSRSRFINLFPIYKKGHHIGNPKFDNYITYRKCRELTITAKEDFLRLCVDGELYTYEKVHFKVIPQAFRFIVPRGI